MTSPGKLDSAENTASGRTGLVDVGRFLACLAIIWIHAAESPTGKSWIPACRWAVPFFTAALAAFAFLRSAARNSGDRGFPGFALKRFKKLYVPFLCWSVIYLVMRYSKHAFAGGGSPIVWSPAMLLSGSTNHLWFLPFAFLVSLVCYGAAQLSRQKPGWKAGMSVFYASLAAMVCGIDCPVPMDPEHFPLSYFVGLCWDALPSIFGALALVQQPINGGFWPKMYPWIALACFGGLVFVGNNRFFSHGCGLSLFGACWTLKCSNLPKWLATAVAFSFGIYLSHIVFVEGLQVVASRIGFAPSLGTDLIIFAGSAMASQSLSMFIQKSALSPFLLPR